MDAASVTAVCPNCAELCAAPEPGGTQPDWWRSVHPPTADVECPTCGWEFAVNDEGHVTDDGGLDLDGPFEVNAEGELSAETLLAVTCPHCGRRFKVDEPAVTTCPGCRRQFPVPDEPVPRSGWAWRNEEAEDEGHDDESFCPCCHDQGDYDGSELTPLWDGWIECGSCSWAFHDATLFTELVGQEREYRLAHGCVDGAAFTVAADGSGDFTLLEDAIDKVGDRGRIVLRPGTYSGQIRTELRQLTIIGAGGPDAVRLAADLDVRTGCIQLSGVRLSRSLRVHQAAAVLDQCVIDGAPGAGLRLTGSHGRARLRGCTIRGCQGPAVYIPAGGHAHLSDCLLADNGAAGLSVAAGGWARLRRCAVSRNGGPGVLAEADSSAFLHGCQVAHNRRAGVELRQRCRAFVAGSAIADNGRAGLAVGRNGRLLLSGCRVHGSGSSGVRLAGRARAAVSRCHISGSGRVGVAMGPRVRVVLRYCEVNQNNVGIRLAATATVGLRDCVCRDNRSADWDIDPGGRLRLAPH